MKNNIMIGLLLAFMLTGLMMIGCNPNTKKVSRKKVKVHCYKIASQTGPVTSRTDDDWIYWYLLMADNNTYYYYSSPTPVTSFTGVTFARSTTFPIIDFNGKTVDQKDIQEEQEMEVDAEEITDNIESEIAEGETTETIEEVEVTETESSETGDVSDGDSGSDAGSDGGGE